MAMTTATDVVTEARQAFQRDRPATSIDETMVMETAARTARLATNDHIRRAAGIFEQSLHGANKTAPTMTRKDFIAKLDEKPVYKEKSFAEKVVMWETYMKNAQQERILMTRGDLGVSAPTIDLNNCSADQLERVPS